MTISAPYQAASDLKTVDINYAFEIAGVTTVFSKKALQAFGGDNEATLSKLSWNPPKLSLDNPKVSIGTVSINLIDPTGALRDAIAVAPLHKKLLTLKAGYTNIDFADYLTLAHFNINEYASGDGISYTIKGRDIMTEIQAPVLFKKTFLTVDMTDISTAVVVSDTSGFPASGTLFIDDEKITYSAKGPVAFTGLTRGVEPDDHKEGADCFEFVTLEDNPVNIMLRMLVSEGGGSIYDDLDFGLGMDSTRFNIQSFEDVRDNSTLAGDIWKFEFVSDIDNLLKFLEKEIFQFSNTRLFIDQNGLISCSLFQEITLDQFAGKLQRTDTVGLPAGVSNSDRLVNQFPLKYDFNQETGKFQQERTFNDTDSQAVFGVIVGKTQSSKGIRQGLDGESRASDFAKKYFRRVAEPFNLIKKLKTTWNRQFFQAGDKVDFSHDQVIDLLNGKIGVQNLMEIISTKFDFDKGEVTYEVNNAPFLNFRYGFISPSSPIVSAASTTVFTLKTGEAVRGDWQVGWFVDLYLISDGSSISAPHEITDITGDQITVGSAMSVTPSTIHGIRFANYDQVSSDQKFYGFVTDGELTFPSDGGDPYLIS